MRQTHYLVISAAVFSIVAAAHVARLLVGWDVSLGGWPAPQWLSIPGVLVPGALSAWGFTLASRARAATL